MNLEKMMQNYKQKQKLFQEKKRFWKRFKNLRKL